MIFGILFVMKVLHLKPLWGPIGVLRSYEYGSCHPVDVCLTVTTAILFVTPY